MNELKKILIKLFVLIADILLLAFDTIKHIVLPNRKRKGNLLSSLFIFFIAIVERLTCFEHGVFSIAKIFRKNYVRQTVFIIGVVLFLLSLFEWTGDQRFSYNETTNYLEHLLPKEVNKTEAGLVKDAFLTDKPEKNQQVFFKQNTFYNSPTFSTSVKKFLLVRCMRV
jgi:hypothetical protein